MHEVPALVLDLDGSRGCVRQARRATEVFLHAIDTGRTAPLSDQLRQDVVLVVSELVANACVHAPGPCRLTVARSGPRMIDITVEDTLPELLTLGRHGPVGYGLLAVTGLSRGIHIISTRFGKAIHATITER